MCSKKVTSVLTQLRAVSKIIQDSIDTIDTVLTANHMEFPSPETQFTIESEASRMLPDVANACMLIVSAASQLTYWVRPPGLTVVATALQVR